MRLSPHLSVSLCLCLCPLWSLLVSPVTSITVTTVFAGKKKFKAYNLGIPFLPTLVKVKPNKFHFTVRQNRYIRPPSFKIEGSLPFKVPTILMPKPDPYAPVQEININTDLHLGGNGNNKAHATIGNEQPYAASEPASQTQEQIVEPPMANQEQQHVNNEAFFEDNQHAKQMEAVGDQSLEQYSANKAPEQMESSTALTYIPFPPTGLQFPMSPVDPSAPLMSFPPLPPPNMFPMIDNSAVPSFDAGQLFYQQQQQQPQERQKHHIRKRSTNLHEPYHHHLNPQLSHLRHVPSPPPPPPMALVPHGIPFFLPPPQLPGNNRFLAPPPLPGKQYYRPQPQIYITRRSSSAGMNQLTYLPSPPSHFTSSTFPLPESVPHPPTPMAFADSSPISAEVLDSVTPSSDLSATTIATNSKRNPVPMKINIGEHYNPNMIYIDESLVPNIDELHGMPLELSGSSSNDQPQTTFNDQTISPTISLDSVSTSQETNPGDGENQQPDESSNYKYHKYYHPKVYDDGPDDFRISFSFSGPHGGPSVYKGYGDNMDQYNKQLNKYHSKDMLPPGLTPKQIHQYYVGHTFTNHLPIYGHSKSIKMTKSGLMKWLLG